jgi:hypothetical protein
MYETNPQTIYEFATLNNHVIDVQLKPQAIIASLKLIVRELLV